MSYLTNVSVFKTELEDIARSAGSTLLRLAEEEQARLPSQIQQAKKGLAQAIQAIEDEIAEWKSLGQDYMNDHPRAQRKLAQLEEELRELKDQAMKRFDEFVHPEPPNQYQHLFDFHSLRKQQVYGSQAMRRAGERHARLMWESSVARNRF
ncbi:hypothetical protein JCM5353_008828 [Sporobolomyces roseus]